MKSTTTLFTLSKSVYLPDEKDELGIFNVKVCLPVALIVYGHDALE